MRTLWCALIIWNYWSMWQEFYDFAIIKSRLTSMTLSCTYISDLAIVWGKMVIIKKFLWNKVSQCNGQRIFCLNLWFIWRLRVIFFFFFLSFFPLFSSILSYPLSVTYSSYKLNKNFASFYEQRESIFHYRSHSIFKVWILNLYDLKALQWLGER